MVGPVRSMGFRGSGEGVPQGGVLSTLLSDIILQEFDAWLEENT